MVNCSKVTLREFAYFTFNNVYHQFNSRRQIIRKDGIACTTSICTLCCVLFTRNVLKDVSDLPSHFPFIWFYLGFIYFCQRLKGLICVYASKHCAEIGGSTPGQSFRLSWAGRTALSCSGRSVQQPLTANKDREGIFLVCLTQIWPEVI